MKRLPLFSSILALSLAMSMPDALAHVGHGDEFQAEGGVDRVEVNAETDPLLGIQVNPIEPSADGSGRVMIPVAALVEDNDRQWVFVLYENFYEPVPVTTGATEGELIEILDGVSVGEQLVTQGSLSLYAESRKTQ
ncbi:MAG: cobalt transporter, partial [Cyanobacteria bacterium P01_H01_bin.58]